jgi:hypothetical protein
VSVFFHSTDQIPDWHKIANSTGREFSLAGWWHAAVSLPLLLALLLGWIWRLYVWARLLWAAAQFDLRLVASHPDRAGGLGFVGYSVGAFFFVVLAIATIVAGHSAHAVMQNGTLSPQIVAFNGGLLAAVVSLFVLPLFIFTPALIKAWRAGVLHYDTLAEHAGSAFENEWLRSGGAEKKSILETPAFSAVTDLYAIVSNAHAMRVVPIDLKSVLILATATILPFIPVAFLIFPTAEILAGVKALLF